VTSAYPGSLDAFGNPGPTTQRNASGLEHSAQHTNVNDAVEAIEGELGTDPAGAYATVKARLDAADYNASLTSSYWKFKTGTSDTDPGAGQFTMNNAAKASATFLYLDDLTGGGTDVSNFMPLLAANDKVFIQDQNDAAKRVRYNITGVAVDGTGYWKIPVISETAAGGEITNNDDCLLVWTIGALGAASSSNTYLRYPLDLVALDGAYGDEFDESSLNGRWTRRNVTSGQEAYQQGASGSLLAFTHSATTQEAYYQSYSNIDLDISMSFTRGRAGEYIGGLQAIDSAGTGVGASAYEVSSSAYLIVHHITTYAYSATYSLLALSVADTYGKRVWLRLTRVGNDWRAYMSIDGDVWGLQTPATISRTVTVDRIGHGRCFGSSADAIYVDRFNVV